MTVVAAFDELLTRLALTSNQGETASARHLYLRDFLNKRFVLAEETWLTGSYSRQTIVRQDRDIDVMSAFSVSSYWATYQFNSSGLVQLVRDALNKEYGSSDVSASGAAVVMRMSDGFNVDVVPVFKRTGGGYLVADGSSRWKATNPPFHFNLMKKRNGDDPRLKPLVKIAKYWNICNDELLESFHLEMMMERMWQNATISSCPYGMKESLRVLPGWLSNSFADPWPEGGGIDGYLSPATRAKAVGFARSDAVSSEKAERLRTQGYEKSAFDEWQKVFRGEFPAYG